MAILLMVIKGKRNDLYVFELRLSSATSKPRDFVLRCSVCVSIDSVVAAGTQAGKKMTAADVDNLTKSQESKLEAVLRRACKPTRKGSLQVPESVHKMWKKGGNSRRELRKVLLRCHGDKEP